MARVIIPGFRKIEVSGGGEGGTTNYNDLTNKPSINNVPLVGNLRTVDLKLTDKTLTEEGVPAESKTVGTKLEEHSTSLLTLKEQLRNHTVKSDVPENAVFTDTVYDDTEVQSKLNNKRDKVLSGSITDNRQGFYKIATITDSSKYSFISFGIDISNGTYYDRISVVLRKSPDGFSVEGSIIGSEANSIKVSRESTTTLGLYVRKNMPYTDTFYEIYNLRGEANQVKIKGCSPTKASESIEYLALPYYYNLTNKNRNIISELSDRISDNGYGEVAGGKNLFQSSNTFSGINSLFNLPINLKPNTTYTFSLHHSNDGGSVQIAVTDDSNNQACDSTIAINFGKPSTESVTFSTNSIKATRIGLYSNVEQVISNIQVEEGTQATEYEPYFPSNKMLAEDVADIKNDLGGLSFSVSGTTLSITDGTNTWTLSQ